LIDEPVGLEIASVLEPSHSQRRHGLLTDEPAEDETTVVNIEPSHSQSQRRHGLLIDEPVGLEIASVLEPSHSQYRHGLLIDDTCMNDGQADVVPDTVTFITVSTEISISGGHALKYCYVCIIASFHSQGESGVGMNSSTQQPRIIFRSVLPVR